MDYRPEYELHFFTLTLHEAIFLAQAGEVLSGFRCLADGFDRVRGAVDRGETWARDLAPGYQRSLDAYTRRYGRDLFR